MLNFHLNFEDLQCQSRKSIVADFAPEGSRTAVRVAFVGEIAPVDSETVGMAPALDSGFHVAAFGSDEDGEVAAVDSDECGEVAAVGLDEDGEVAVVLGHELVTLSYLAAVDGNQTDLIPSVNLAFHLLVLSCLPLSRP